ncbi:unnamed protein product, partial [Citrullus colocynthis]
TSSPPRVELATTTILFFQLRHLQQRSTDSRFYAAFHIRPPLAANESDVYRCRLPTSVWL